MITFILCYSLFIHLTLSFLILQFSRDSWGRLHTVVVAIDAKPHVNYEKQISPKNVKRELEKVAISKLFFQKVHVQ